MPLLDIQEIRDILPHRYPMLLVDSILELEEERIVGIKNVTVNEPFFVGHFPDFPVMPGVLMVEAMAQVAGVLVLKSSRIARTSWCCWPPSKQAKFRRPVRPGDQLRIEMKVTKRKASVAKMHGQATVDGVVVAEAELMCKLQDREPRVGSPVADEPVPVPKRAHGDSSDCHRRPTSSDLRKRSKSGRTASSAPSVEIGARTRLMAHVYVEGVTHIGEDNIFYPYSTVGVASQDLKYKGERAETRIGSRNKIREFVTIHRGTEGGGLVTEIGDDNLLMAYAHVAHDVRIGDHTQLGNAVTFAGHVVVEDWAVIEAFSGVHQFCRIGKHAFVGGYSVVTQDVLPFSMTVSPRESKVFGENKVGLERRGFTQGIDRKPAQGIPALDQVRAQYDTGRGANSRGSARLPGGERSARVHRTVRARVYQVRCNDEPRYGMIAGNGRFPLLALETARASGR